MTKDASEYPVLVNAIVGSRAHGLARPGSDVDYRQVFYVPTRALLELPVSGRPKDAWMAMGAEDRGGYELGHFLELAMKGNPNIVELFWTTIESATADGLGMLGLRDHVLAADPLTSAFLGYANNARVKIVSDAKRTLKWQSTYIRVLSTARQLLESGHVRYPITEYAWGHSVAFIRDGKMSVDTVLEYGADLEATLMKLKTQDVAIRRMPDVAAVNEWLQVFRKDHWDE